MFVHDVRTVWVERIHKKKANVPITPRSIEHHFVKQFFHSNCSRHCMSPYHKVWRTREKRTCDMMHPAFKKNAIFINTIMYIGHFMPPIVRLLQKKGAWHVMANQQGIANLKFPGLQVEFTFWNMFAAAFPFQNQTFTCQ